MAKQKRAPWAVVIVLIVAGSTGFLNLSGKERFKAFRTVDVVQLLATGMCYGVALARIVSLIRRPDHD